MNEKIDKVYKEEYNGNNVIDRGYAIYDEWSERNATSKMIVASVETSVRAMSENKTMSKCAEALAYLFALDMRIRERYNTILKRIFLYFFITTSFHSKKSKNYSSSLLSFLPSF